MNKLTKLLSVFVIAGAIGTGVAGAVGCNNTPEPDPGPGGDHTTHNLTYTNNGDGTHDATCDGCDLVIDNEPHDFTDGNCVCGEQHTHKYTNVIDGNNGYHIKACECGKTAGSYKLHDWNDETNKCVDCGADKYVSVKFELDVTNDLAVGKVDEDRSTGIFTLGANTEVRTKTPVSVYKNEAGGEKIADVPYTSSIKIGGSGDKLYINAPAPGKLIIHAANGSSGTTSGMATVSLSKPAGSTAPGTIDIVANDMACRQIEIELDKKGQYSIGRIDGTRDIYYISFECEVENTVTKEIKVISSGTDQYFVGQEFTANGVAVNKVSESLVETPIDLTDKCVKVDSSKVDTTKSGVYPVEITYNDGKDDFTTSYNVTVYAVDSLKIGKDAIIKGANSAAGNGVYENHHLRELYFTGNKLSTDGMTVILDGSIGTGADKKTQSFRLNEKEYVITGDELSGTGKKTVTVTVKGTTVAETFEVYVMAPVDLSTAETVNVKVDATTNDTQVGLVADGAYQFQTIHQALEFLENCKAPASAKKTISLAAGLYTEKVDINVPNLTIEGVGTDMEGTYSMIEWDSLYGIEDEGGFIHTTDSTATMHVGEKAVGFTMKNVVLSNWYNSEAHFDEKLGANYGEHRALAMLVRADKVTIEDCTLLGYQDTLELFTGRHIFRNCLITGATDFIFGTNGTTYFTGCEIRSINCGKVGYITAFKGENKGKDTDSIKYGAIFDGCNFTAEANTPGGWAIGRTWGASAAVMVMNSTIGDHVSVSASTRYLSMNGNAPANAQFTEYGNTGAGAISESITGVTVTDKTTADTYADFATIFGTTNGKVKYADAWEGSAGAKITSVTYDLRPYAGDALQNGATGEYEGVSIDATNGKFEAHSQDSVHITAGLVLTIPMDKRYKVTFTWYGGGDTYADKNMKVEYVEESGAVTALKLTFVDKQCYLCTIVVDKQVEMRVLTVKDKDTDEVIGTKLVEEGASVTKEQISAIVTGNAAYSSKNVDKVYSDATNEYAGAAIDGDTTLYVTTVDADIIYDESQTIKLIDGALVCPNVNAGETKKFKGIEINGGTGSFTINSSNDWMYLTPGATIKIKVAEGATVKVTEHNSTAGNASASARDNDGWVTISTETATYINAISVAYDHTYAAGENIDLKLSTTPVIDGVTITGSVRGNGNSIQVGTDTVIRIKAQSGTTAHINWFAYANANDNNAQVSFDSTSGEIVISIQASDSGAPADSIYIVSIDIVAAE